MSKKRPGTRFWTATGILAFLLGGIINMTGLRRLDALQGASQTYYAVLVLCWAVSMRQRIVHRHIRRSMFLGVGLILLFLIIQQAKYSFFSKHSDAARYLWYAYYVPMTGLPVMLLYTALDIGRSDGNRIPRQELLLLIPPMVLIGGVFTNEIHQWAFRFPFGIQNIENMEYTRGPVFHAAATWIGAVLLISIIIILRKCRIRDNRDRIIIPLLLVGVCGAYLLWTCTRSFAVGRKPYNVGELYCFMIIALWESCIQTSLIPANSKYGSFFNLSTVRGQITDNAGTVCFASENALELTRAQRLAARGMTVMLDPDTRLCSQPVRGGYAFWTEDISAYNRMNAQLTEVRNQLSEYNVLLKAEADASVRQIRAAEKNGLYDAVAAAVRYQLNRVDAILSGTDAEDPELKKKLSEACVLTAFIKRRANLSLIGEVSGRVSAYELEASIRESAEYLTISGIRCNFQRSCEGMLLKRHAIAAYEIFEAVAEAALSGLEAVLINLSVKDGAILLRMTMDGQKLVIPVEQIADAQCHVTCELTERTEDGTVFVTLRMGEEAVI